MVAAIYARKSTDQNISDEQRSVTRQVARAREYAARKGWTTPDEHLYVDDGVSGAEFENRPALQRLLAALKPRPSFQVLIIYDLDRLGRDQIETISLMKRIVESGVVIADLSADRLITPETLADTMEVLLLQVRAFAATTERKKAGQRSKDALARRAKAGYVTGGRRFGYHNVAVCSSDGKRDHVERRINEGEGDVVRRVFDLVAQGFGVLRIAKRLNAEGVPSPRSRGWSPSTVRDMVECDLYRGVVIWNKTAGRDVWGRQKKSRRPSNDWVCVEVPGLQIVDDDLWQRAHERLAGSRAAYLRRTNGQVWGHPVNGIESKYLLTGLATCALCGGALTPRRTRGRSGSRPTPSSSLSVDYRCLSRVQKGRAGCSNGLALPMRRTDEAVLSLIEREVLRPEVVKATVEEALRRLNTPDHQREAERERLESSLATIEQQLRQLANAVAAGGELPTLIGAIKDRERQHEAFRRQITSLDSLTEISHLDTARLERDLTVKLREWRGLLLRHVQSGREILKTLLVGKLRFTPSEGGCAFEGEGRLEPLLAGTLMFQGPKASGSPLVLHHSTERQVGDRGPPSGSGLKLPLVLLQVAPGDQLVRRVEPFDLSQARQSGSQVRDVHFAGLVVVREVAHPRSIRGDLDHREGRIGEPLDLRPGPLLGEGGRRDGESEEREDANGGPHGSSLASSMAAARRGAMSKKRYAAASLPPGPDRVLQGWVERHLLMEARHLENLEHVVAEGAEPDVSSGLAGPLHRLHQLAQA